MPDLETKTNGTNDVLSRNIRTLLALRRKNELKAAFYIRIADRVTSFAGSITFFGIQLTIFSIWLIVNLGWTRFPCFDPTFIGLATTASVEAIFLTIFVLISQKRLGEQNENHAHLNLQISLLAEHEITRILQILSKLAAEAGIHDGHSADVEDLKRHVVPEEVMECIEKEKVKVFKAPKER